MALFLLILEAETTQSLSHQRIFRDKLSPLDTYNDFEFISRYRLTRYVFIQLHTQIVGFLNRSTHRSHFIPNYQISCCTSISCNSFVSDCNCNRTWVISTIGIKMHWCRLGCTLLICKGVITFPNQKKQTQVQQSVLNKARFPLLLGCIDATHVQIVALTSNEEIFINRKNEHSIIIQAICDDNLKFIDVVAKWPET